MNQEKGRIEQMKQADSRTTSQEASRGPSCKLHLQDAHDKQPFRAELEKTRKEQSMREEDDSFAGQYGDIHVTSENRKKEQ